MAKDRKAVKPVAEAGPGITNVSVTLDLPLAELCGTEYVPRGRTHVEVQLAVDEARMLKRLQDGLRATGVQLPDGRYVFSRGDVFRYLLSSFKS